MSTLTQHRIWHLGDDVSTDDLAPGHTMKSGLDVIAKHCLETVLPQFASQVKRGDVIVAGRNFGIGSSREQAAQALVHLGIRAVIAPSYSGLFFRNAFNVGLLLMTCSDANSLLKEEHLALNSCRLDAIFSNKQELLCEPIPEFLRVMVQHGGLLAQLRNEYGQHQH
jgi:3-isopropylmalate/(R)-2-methylmalate dehydratase small subunit